MARSLVSKSLSSRLNQASASELQSSITLGPPVTQPTVGGETIAASENNAVTVNQWVAMTQADQGLLDALYDFVNTTKEGVQVVPNNIAGRTKKLFFNFYGTMGKTIKPGEIGQFEVNFTYPPQSSTASGTASTL